jgi:hypothetical protein
MEMITVFHQMDSKERFTEVTLLEDCMTIVHMLLRKTALVLVALV